MAKKPKEQEEVKKRETKVVTTTDFNGPELVDEIIPTKIIPMDMHLDGGIYRGDMIEFAGDTGVGKSTALTQMSSNICGQGYKILYLDFERGQKQHDKSVINNVGLGPYIESGQFILKKNLLTYSHLEEGYDWAFKNKVDIIILDSITAVIPEALLTNSIEKVTIGVDARLQTSFVRKFKALGQINGVSTIFINQLRTKIAMGYGEKTEKVSSGADAMKFYCDVRFFVERGARLTRQEITGVRGKEEVTFGNKARILTVKNRANRPEIKIPFPVIFGKGVSNPYFFYEILNENGYVTGGAWKELALPNLTIRENGEMKFIAAIARHKEEIFQFLHERNHFELIIEPEETTEINSMSKEEIQAQEDFDLISNSTEEIDLPPKKKHEVKPVEEEKEVIETITSVSEENKDE